VLLGPLERDALSKAFYACPVRRIDDAQFLDALIELHDREGRHPPEFGRNIRDCSAKRDPEACSESLEILIQGPQYGVGSQQH